MNKGLIRFIVFAILILGGIVFTQSNLVPVGIKRMFHLMTMPKDLFDPILKDKFHFWEKDFTKTYKLIPKYSDIYALGFICENEKIPSGWGKKNQKYEFNGKVKVELYSNGDIVLSSVIDTYKTCGFVKDDDTKIKSVELYTFEIPLQGKHKRNISMKLTVVEPDEYLRNFKDSAMLYVGVSSTP